MTCSHNKMAFFKSSVFLFLIVLSSFAQANDETIVSEIRYLHVQKGQTLHNIVKRLYPNKTKQWPSIINEIIQRNPHAFIEKKAALMRAGVRLTLPVNKTEKTFTTVKKVGFVDSVSGGVIAVNKSKISRKLFKGYPVYIGDKVITGEDGFVRLKMIDNAVLDLRCFSIMVIEDYAMNSVNRRSILNLLQGSLKKITGQIGKLKKDVYQLKTPIASIGVRGTEYALRVFQSKGCGGTIDTDEGLYLEVIKGLVDVHNAAGDAVVAKGETVYVPLPNVVPKKVKIDEGVIRPAPKVIQVVKQEIEEDNVDYWWWLLGIAAFALLI